MRCVAPQDEMEPSNLALPCSESMPHLLSKTISFHSVNFDVLTSMIHRQIFVSQAKRRMGIPFLVPATLLSSQSATATSSFATTASPCETSFTLTIDNPTSLSSTRVSTAIPAGELGCEIVSRWQSCLRADVSSLVLYSSSWGGCSSCTPGRYCLSESRCILDDVNYPCSQWI